MGGNRKCRKFADGRQSLLAAFVDVIGVLLKTLLSRVSLTFPQPHQHPNSFTIDADGVAGWAVIAERVDNQVFCFCNIHLKVILLAQFGKWEKES